MSYVSLNTNIPPGLGATAYEECEARNAAKHADFDPVLTAWEVQKVAYDQYKLDYKEWDNARQKRSSMLQQQAASYAGRMASYNAKMEAYETALAEYQQAVQYNRVLRAEDSAKKSQVERKYGIKFPSSALCLDATQKASVKRTCEAGGVKGLGYIFKVADYPACALNELNVCRPMKPEISPGAPPVPPTKAEPPPPLPPAPPVVTDPGPKPPSPKYETCQESSVGGIATFGLLAVLVVGGGVFGYRQWKKRKKAA